MKSATAFLLCAFLGVASARMAYQFAAGYEEIVGQPSQTFSCDNRAYGYYADVDNDCRVFHVCLPVVDEVGETLSVDHFSFICGNQTVFSQESLTCADPLDAFPCEQAPTLYDVVNAEFGRIPDSDY
ncbi:U-scoloptoxin(01)-Cw1a-like [Macrobrachium nipponense]|uniref:U-scoloptoxin(01)-Cw1a-like n=1 Tax=Macrobrachium nipponense TaxID=159736 RepID=UPI0030C84FE6